MIYEIETSNAPKAIGPYSQGVIAPSHASLIFVSGQIPIDPQTGKLWQGSFSDQAECVINQLEAILKAGNSSLSNVLRVEIFLTDLKNHFQELNKIYTMRFTGRPHPARQTIQVSNLPLESPIEISCIAMRNS